ncbi:MAG: AI-2E family transporter [Caulobacteraceae bacterium]
MDLSTGDPIAPPEVDESATGQLLNLAVSAVVVGALYFAREILVPITLAVLLAFLLAPLVQLLRRWKAPRAPAVLLAAGFSLAVLLTLGSVIGSQVSALIKEAPRYEGVFEAKLKTLNGLTTGRLMGVVSRLGPALAKVTAPPPADPADQVSEAKGAKPIPVIIRQPAPNAFDLVRRLAGPVLRPLATTALVFVLAVFILLQQTDLRDRMIRLLGAGDLHRTSGAMDDAAERLSRYFLSQLAVNAGFGALIGAGLYFIGVPHTLLWAAVAALMRFVPYLGGIISAALPAALAAAIDPGWTMVAWTIALFVVLETFTGQVVEPFFYGRSTGLSPVSVVVAAIFWSWLWGPLGLILSTPLSLCLLVLGRHVPRLAYIEVLLGDRPPLTPPESFYQRALAGDSDETLEQADALLKDGPLSIYYDEVAMKGLAMAAADQQRGVLRPQQLSRIRDTVTDLSAVFADRDDEIPAAAATGGQAGPVPEERGLTGSPPGSLTPDPGGQRPIILCVPTHGVLDEAANMMLAQLLEKHGMQARLLPREAMSRARRGDLDISGVSAVCISYFPCGQSHTRLRFLIRALHAQSPRVPLVLGAWHEDDPASAAGGPIASPDVAVASLRQAVEACVALCARTVP